MTDPTREPLTLEGMPAVHPYAVVRYRLENGNWRVTSIEQTDTNPEAASPLSVEITDEMVRRVARAIFDNGATTEWTPEIGERLGKQARAAILAMQSVAALRSSGIDGGE